MNLQKTSTRALLLLPPIVTITSALLLSVFYPELPNIIYQSIYATGSIWLCLTMVALDVSDCRQATN